MIRTLTITDASRGLSTVLKPRPAGDLGLTSFQFDPAVRAVEESKVGGHGSRDDTERLDAGVLSVGVVALTGTRAFIDDLAQYCRPRARPVLVVDDDEWDQPRTLTLRFDSASKPIQAGRGLRREILYTFKVTSGVWEGLNFTVAGIAAFIPSTTGLTWAVTTGITWSVSVGITWPASSAPQPSQVINTGGEEANWTALLYGPCSGPRFANDTAGLTLEFKTDLVLAAGDYVALSSADQSMLLNSLSPVDSLLNYPTSDWWLMQPGTNTIRYYPFSAGAGSQALLSFKPAWLP